MGMKKNLGRGLAAILFLAGASPTFGTDKGVAQAQTKHADKQVTPSIERKRKKTPLGGDYYQKTNKPWFKPTYKQMRKKHTNTKHKSHSAKVKKRKKKNGR